NNIVKQNISICDDAGLEIVTLLGFSSRRFDGFKPALSDSVHRTENGDALVLVRPEWTHYTLQKEAAANANNSVHYVLALGVSFENKNVISDSVDHFEFINIDHQQHLVDLYHDVSASIFRILSKTLKHTKNKSVCFQLLLN